MMKNKDINISRDRVEKEIKYLKEQIEKTRKVSEKQILGMINQITALERMLKSEEEVDKERKEYLKKLNSLNKNK